MTDEELYRRSFCTPSDVSKAEILRTAIRNAKAKGHKTGAFWKMRRKQLTGVVNSQSLDKRAVLRYTGEVKSNGEL